MAKVDSAPKSLPQAKASRRPLAARPAPPGADSEPCRAAADKLEGQRVDDPKNASTKPYIEVVFSLDDESGLASKQGRFRRRYEPEERRRVAATRARGACDDCKASKIKCLHDSSKITTDQYQSQTESHERFALGLTTPSLIENKDEHTQVMVEKIAALDDKLDEAQENTPGKSHDARDGRSSNAAAVVAPLLSPERIGQVGPPIQKHNYPAEVHQSLTQPIQERRLKECMNRFRVTEDSKRKISSLKRQHKVANSTHCREKSIVCQRPIGSALSISVVDDTPIRTPTQRLNRQASLICGSTAAPKAIEPGCKSLLLSTSGAQRKTLNVLPLKPKQQWATLSRQSDTSEEDSHTIVTDEGMLSYGRSLSPRSDRLPYNPPPYVHLPDLERSKSYDPSATLMLETLSPDSNTMEGIEPFLIEDLLFDDIIDFSATANLLQLAAE